MRSWGGFVRPQVEDVGRDSVAIQALGVLAFAPAGLSDEAEISVVTVGSTAAWALNKHRDPAPRELPLRLERPIAPLLAAAADHLGNRSMPVRTKVQGQKALTEIALRGHRWGQTQPSIYWRCP